MMQLEFTSFAMVCTLVFLAGFVDAIAGGGGLISLPAYLMTGLPAHMAIATNKFSAAAGTTMATVKYARSGYIPLKMAIISVALALIGSFIGAKLCLLIPAEAFRVILLAVLPLTALYTVFSKGLRYNSEREPFSETKTVIIAAAAAFVIGVYDGFYGPGTGTFLILLLTGIARMEITKANGISKVINLASNYAALAVFISDGQVIYPLGIAAALFSVIGNYLGSLFFQKKGAKNIKYVILIVLAIFFVKVIIELIRQ